MSREEEGIAVDSKFHEKINYIVSQIQNAGYDPYAQLTGFVSTCDDRYITRKGNARGLIWELDLTLLSEYLKHMNP